MKKFGISAVLALGLGLMAGASQAQIVKVPCGVNQYVDISERSGEEWVMWAAVNELGIDESVVCLTTVSADSVPDNMIVRVQDARYPMQELRFQSLDRLYSNLLETAENDTSTDMPPKIRRIVENGRAELMEERAQWAQRKANWLTIRPSVIAAR